MSNTGFHISLDKFKYPGEGYFYGICDICGRKKRVKFLTKITDKYNLYYGSLVCKGICEDKTNPQQFIKSFKDNTMSSPQKVRVEQPDSYVSQNSSVLSTAPTMLLATLLPLNATVSLTWQGPLDPGSADITGYTISRENPIGGGFGVLVTTTSPSTYYNDTQVSKGTQYNYKVAAVTAAGTSSYSNTSSIQL